MFGECRRKYKLGTRAVLNEPRWSKTLNRLVVLEPIFTTARRFLISLFHAATATAICFSFTASPFHTESLCGIKNGTIARTPTEVAVKSLLNVVLRWTRVIPQ